MKIIYLFVLSLMSTMLSNAANAEFSLVAGNSAKTQGSDRLTISFSPVQDPATGYIRSGTLIYTEVALSESPDYSVLPKEFADFVTLEPVQIGGFAGIHLMVDSASTIDQELTVTISLPNGAEKSSADRLAPAELAKARGIFLNGDQVRYRSAVPNAEKGANSLASNPLPGDYRAAIAEGNQLIRLDPTNIPGSLSPSAELELSHQGMTLPNLGVLPDELLFYIPENTSKTSEDDSVFISESQNPATVATTREAYLTQSAELSEHPHEFRREVEPNLIYERGAISPNGERFVAWRIRNGESFSHTLTVPDQLVSSSVSFETLLFGFTFNSADPDHYADLSLNDVAIPRTSWDGRTEHVTTGTVQLTETAIGFSQDFTLTHEIDPSSPFAGGVDFQNLESYAIEYTALPGLPADGPAILEFDAASTPTLVSVSNIPDASSVTILDITDPYNPVRLLNPGTFTSGSGTFSVEFEHTGGEAVYLVQDITTADSQTAIVISETFDSGFTATDVVIENIFVRDEVYADEMVPLINQLDRTSYSFSPQAAYNHFNHGQSSPEAIQQALKMLVDEAPGIAFFPNITLIGDGSYDRKNVLQANRPPTLPIFIEDSIPTNGIAIESSIDFPYTLLRGDDFFPDATIGRLPVHNEAELQLIVDRQLLYNQSITELFNQDRLGLFVTDNESQFTNEIPFLEGKWQENDLTSRRVDVDGVTDTEEVIAALEDHPGGAAFVMYTGHGNDDRWAAERIITVDDVPNIRTRDQWPVVVAFTCLNGNYAFPNSTNRSLSEVWLITPEDGAIFNVSPSSVDGFGEHLLFSQEYMISLSENFPPLSAGDWMQLALIRYLTAYPGLERTARGYMAFGIPSSKLTFQPDVAILNDQWLIQ